ncbi:DUF1330 domain-containing protein [Paraburkholderia sp. GAS334]|jgi:uncharacterized protein (DUF1330 family)|uniref:DUF1330 domain-containing protein n=1 Tax=Paraburkholderia sp. GAS334 TaxID=3035131 RepID=UPI003D1E2CB5
MAAYVIFMRENTVNAEELKTYSQLAPSTLGGHPGTPRVFYGALDILEGSNFEGAVVLEFPSAAEARTWYDSPDYQAVALHRRAGANYRVFIVEGVSHGRV